VVWVCDGSLEQRAALWHPPTAPWPITLDDRLISKRPLDQGREAVGLGMGSTCRKNSKQTKKHLLHGPLLRIGDHDPTLMRVKGNNLRLLMRNSQKPLYEPDSVSFLRIRKISATVQVRGE
jgi:hypothetical protein